MFVFISHVLYNHPSSELQVEHFCCEVYAPRDIITNNKWCISAVFLFLSLSSTPSYFPSAVGGAQHIASINFNQRVTCISRKQKNILGY